MKQLSAKVVDGKIVVDAQQAPRGTPVTVYVDGDLEELQLDAEMQAELVAAADAIARGDYLTPDELFQMLRSTTKGSQPRSRLTGKRLARFRMLSFGGRKTDTRRQTN